MELDFIYNLHVYIWLLLMDLLLFMVLHFMFHWSVLNYGIFVAFTIQVEYKCQVFLAEYYLCKITFVYILLPIKNGTVVDQL